MCCAMLGKRIKWMNNFSRLFARIACKKQYETFAKVLAKLDTVDLKDDIARAEIAQELQGIYRGVILDKIGMGDIPLIIYVLSLKYKGRIKTVPAGNDVKILAGGCSVANKNFMAAYIHFVEVKGNILHIEGNISWPVVLEKNYTFGVKNNGTSISCQMFDRKLDLKKGKNTYETRTVFVVDVPLSPEGNRIEFVNYIEGRECICGRIISMRFAPVAGYIRHQYCVREQWMLRIEDGVLYCEAAEPQRVAKQEELFRQELVQRFPQKAEWAIELRENGLQGLKSKEKPIWLFMDRRHRADDNAEVLFRYVREKKEIDSYFIIEEGTDDYNRLKDLGNIVPLYSKQHLELVLQADYMISSQANGEIENPFWEDAEFFRDLYHCPKLVFLQHGVIKDDMSVPFSRYHTNFVGFVTSSKKEWQSILDYSYYYTEKEVWLTGLPRFDKLYNNPQKYILIMPTWRQGLMAQKWHEDKNSMVWEVSDDFLQSEYVQTYQSLLANEQLKQLCKEYGYRVAFMPHALMEPYIDKFIKDDNCSYWDSSKSYREAFAEGNILITDYSSVAFDFAYLQKPVIYYQFDREKFFAEHTYKQGYFDYERDGLGEVVYTEAELLSAISGCLKEQCKVQEKYMERIRDTFAYMDKNNCERVYEYLLKEQEGVRE